MNGNRRQDDRPHGPLRHRIFRVEWLGQTVASLCWIASMLAYGVSTPGDWLQLLAASAWLTSNVAVLLNPAVQAHEYSGGD